MPEIHEEYRVLVEWELLPGQWRRLAFGATDREADATCEAVRLKQKGSYRNVRIERRVVTVGEWEEVNG